VNISYAAINPPLVANLGPIPSAATSLPIGLINQAANLIPSLDPLLAQASVRLFVLD